MSAPVQAAGGLVFDESNRLALIFRPQQQDWSLPKGHLDRGEDHETAALREVLEETGYRCTILRTAGCTEYRNRYGKPKRVTYFQMRVDSGRFCSNAEVEALIWLPLRHAATTLSYQVDRELLAAL